MTIKSFTTNLLTLIISMIWFSFLLTIGEQTVSAQVRGSDDSTTDRGRNPRRQGRSTRRENRDQNEPNPPPDLPPTRPPRPSEPDPPGTLQGSISSNEFNILLVGLLNGTRVQISHPSRLNGINPQITDAEPLNGYYSYIVWGEDLKRFVRERTGEELADRFIDLPDSDDRINNLHFTIDVDSNSFRGYFSPNHVNFLVKPESGHPTILRDGPDIDLRNISIRVFFYPGVRDGQIYPDIQVYCNFDKDISNIPDGLLDITGPDLKLMIQHEMQDMVREFFSPEIRRAIGSGLIELLRVKYPDLSRVVRLAPKDGELLVWYLPGPKKADVYEGILNTMSEEKRSKIPDRNILPAAINRRRFKRL